jgi:hypothetical protein
MELRSKPPLTVHGSPKNDCARREAGHRKNFRYRAARQFDALGRISMIPTWLRPLIAIAMPPSTVGIM